MSADQLRGQEHPGEDPIIQSAIGDALEKKNALLRQMVEGKEDKITELEHKIAQFESGERGTHFTIQFFTSIQRSQYEITVKQFSLRK